MVSSPGGGSGKIGIAESRTSESGITLGISDGQNEFGHSARRASATTLSGAS